MFKKMSYQAAEDLKALAVILFLVLMVGVVVWYVATGAERSTYRYCMSEYGKAYPTDYPGGFRYCYEKTYK